MRHDTERRRTAVVTGGAQGVGRAVVERLVDDDHGVVVVEIAESAAERLAPLLASGDVRVVVGDAGDDAVARRAADEAAAMGVLSGWVNNAAVFRDAWLHEAGGSAVADLVAANLRPALAGAAAAATAFRASGTPGSIVNVSSHQAQRPVGGALPYATAKAAVEGLTRALAVDYGPWGIRANAVALGSIVTDRLDTLREALTAEERAATDAHMRELHPLGRAGLASEVADVVAFLLSEHAAFVTGAVLPVDGGRSVNGPDPERNTLWP